MGEIAVVNNITLDGVMQGPARPDEDTRGGFNYGGWTVPYQDNVLGRRLGEMMANAKGALLLGRRTYEDFYAYWPKQKDNPYTEHLNKAKKYVASTTLASPLPWQNSFLIGEDVIGSIASLKREGESFTVLGSGQLIKALHKENLIDRLVLLIFPIVLGTGLRLFSDGISLKFRLKDRLASSTGVILATYEYHDAGDHETEPYT